MEKRFIGMSDGTLFDVDSLGISLKSGTRQESEFIRMYGDNVIPPQWEFETLANILNKNVYHSVCVSTFSRDVVGMGWNVWNSSGEQDEISKEIAERIKKWGFSEAFRRFLMDKATIGQGFVEVIRGADGQVEELKHMPSVHVALTADVDVFCQVVYGARTYFVRYGSGIVTDYKHYGRTPETEDEQANEVFMGIYYDPANRLYGKAPVIPVLQDVISMVKLTEFNANFFGNNCMPAWAITVSGAFNDKITSAPYSPENPGKITDIIREQLKQIQKNNSPGQAVMIALPSRIGDENGNIEIKFQSLSADMKDMQFKELNETSRNAILSAHQVPPYRLGLAEVGALGGNTASESTEIYKTTKIRPEQSEIEEFVNTLIRDEMGFREYRFEFNEIDTGDEMQDIERVAKERDTWLKEYNSGLITKNEYRKLTGREPLNEFGANMTKDEAAEAGADADLEFSNNLEMALKGVKV